MPYIPKKGEFIRNIKQDIPHESKFFTHRAVDTFEERELFRDAPPNIPLGGLFDRNGILVAEEVEAH